MSRGIGNNHKNRNPVGTFVNVNIVAGEGRKRRPLPPTMGATDSVDNIAHYY